MLRRMTTAVLVLALALPGLATATGERAAFDELIDDIGRTILARQPEDVTDLGLSEELGLDDRKLNDLSYEYRDETAALAQEALSRLAAVEAEVLTPDQQITLAVTEWYLDDIVTMHGYADHEYAVNYITGAHANLPEFLADIHPLTDVAEAEAFVARLVAGGQQLREVADNLGRSETAGNLPTQRGLGIAAWQINNQLSPASGHPIVVDFSEQIQAVDNFFDVLFDDLFGTDLGSLIELRSPHPTHVTVNPLVQGKQEARVVMSGAQGAQAIEAMADRVVIVIARLVPALPAIVARRLSVRLCSLAPFIESDGFRHSLFQLTKCTFSHGTSLLPPIVRAVPMLLL